jgi:hypothetical protein
MERIAMGTRLFSWRGGLAVALVLLTGCSAIANLTVTATPLPTNTPETTATPTATPTTEPSPTPTATPDEAATEAVLQTATMESIQTIIEKALNKLGIPIAGGRVANYQTDPIIVTSSGYDRGFYKRLPMDSDVLDAVIHVDITWTADNGFAECIVMFNIVDDSLQNYYQFEMLKLSGLPYWYASKIANGMYRGGQRSPANIIHVEDGSTNTVVIELKAKTLTYFVNGIKLQTSSDAGLTQPGGYGFMAWQESGKTTCQFGNIWVWTWDK